MKNIFVLNGFPGSGKTLFGKLVSDELREKGVDFLHTSSIDPVKQVLRPEDTWPEGFKNNGLASTLNGLKREVTDKDWDGETKDDYWRRAMSQLKAKILGYDPEFINRWVLRQTEFLSDPSVVFVDMREPENIAAFTKFCGENSKAVRVRSVFIESDMARRDYNNPSDQEILGYNYDIRIVNNRLGFEGDSQRELAAFREEAINFVNLALQDSRNSKERRG